MLKQLVANHRSDTNIVPMALLFIEISLLGFFLTIHIDLISAILCGLGIVGAVAFIQFIIDKITLNSNVLSNNLTPLRFLLELVSSLLLILIFFLTLSMAHPDVTTPGIGLSIGFLSQAQIILSVLSSHCLLYLHKYHSTSKHYFLEAAIASILTGLLLSYGEQDIFYNTNEYLTELLFFSFLVGCAWIIFQTIRQKYQQSSPYLLLKRGIILVLAIIPVDILFNYLFLKFSYDIPLYKDYWYVEIPFKIFVLMAINFAEGLMNSKSHQPMTETEILKVKNGDKINMVPVDTIGYFQAVDGINYLHTHDQKKLMVDETLNKLNDQLNDRVFFRANRQLIISKSAIQSYRSIDHKKIKIEVKGTEDNFIISRITAPEFRKWMAQ